jgi:AraC-like DNA-binding protein
MVAKALDSYGIDGEAALSRVGIDQQLLIDPDIRIPEQQVSELLQLAVAETKEPAFGLKAGTFVCPTTFHALSMSMWLSSSLKDAFDRLVRYSYLLTDVAKVRLEETETEYCYISKLALDVEDFKAMIQLAELDVLHSAIISFCRSLYGESFAPTSVSFIHSAPADTTSHENFYRCPVLFSQPILSLTFSKKDLDKPLASGHPELLKHSDNVIVESLNRFDKQDIAGRLRCKLIELLPSGKPSQREVARALNTSLRSLQRKLSDKGLTYEKVLEDLRRDLAQKYIVQSHLSIGDISYLLGFSSNTNFARSFKSWMNMTPREYRRKNTLKDRT